MAKKATNNPSGEMPESANAVPPAKSAELAMPYPTPAPPRKAVTVRTLQQAKQEGRKITMLTAYDAMMAAWLDGAGVDCILVGDTLGMVVQGGRDTLGVTIGEMIYHGRIVAQAVQHAMVVVDLPFPVGGLGVKHTVTAAAKIMKKTGCAAVKMEGGSSQADSIAAMVDAGIPTIAHIGLRPQSIHAMGGFVVQRNREQLIQDAVAAQEAGAFAVLIECVPAKIAAMITRDLHVPTIGIGAGSGCDGQVLVTQDLLGYSPGRIGRFVRTYADFHSAANNAIRQFCDDVRGGQFPGEAESFQ